MKDMMPFMCTVKSDDKNFCQNFFVFCTEPEKSPINCALKLSHILTADTYKVICCDISGVKIRIKM